MLNAIGVYFNLFSVLNSKNKRLIINNIPAENSSIMIIQYEINKPSGINAIGLFLNKVINQSAGIGFITLWIAGINVKNVNIINE